MITIVTDMNEMSIEELSAINSTIGIFYEINDGKIVNYVH